MWSVFDDQVDVGQVGEISDELSIDGVRSQHQFLREVQTDDHDVGPSTARGADICGYLYR